MSASGAGTVKWQQVSEDLVPVNITCIQDSPECVFHITAYNSQVDKILDVRLVQPGTRIGQASECFVYWKDPMTNDTWGLNFTSPIDAKQFRECCVSIYPRIIHMTRIDILQKPINWNNLTGNSAIERKFSSANLLPIHFEALLWCLRVDGAHFASPLIKIRRAEARVKCGQEDCGPFFKAEDAWTLCFQIYRLCAISRIH